MKKSYHSVSDKINHDFFYLKSLKQVYFEVTNKCNLSCGYCYAVQTKQRAVIFSPALAKKIIDKITLISEHKKIEIIFHGGEPLLQSYQYFSELLTYISSEFKKANKVVDFGIQSNLTLLNDNFIDLFREFNIKISASIDGTEPVHNQARSLWNTTIENFRKLKNSGVSISPIVVCSKHNFKYIDDIFDLFNSLNVKRFQLNIATSNVTFNTETAYVPLTSGEILQVYKDTLNCCIKYNIIEEKVMGMLRRFSGKLPEYGSTLGCDNPFCHAGTEMIVFTPDGNMYPCSPCVALKKMSTDFSFGKFGDSVSKEHYLNVLEKFHIKENKYYNECSQCKGSIICEFNCPGFDRIDPVTRENKCEAIKEFLIFLNINSSKIANFINTIHGVNN